MTLQQNGRALAYLGDAVWSLIVREYLLTKGYGKGKDLHQMTSRFCSAKAQAQFYEMLVQDDFFTAEEMELFKRGRNAYSTNIPNHTDAGTYRISTGFECLLGGLYLQKNQDRIHAIWEKVRTHMGE